MRLTDSRAGSEGSKGTQYHSVRQRLNAALVAQAELCIRAGDAVEGSSDEHTVAGLTRPSTRSPGHHSVQACTTQDSGAGEHAPTQT